VDARTPDARTPGRRTRLTAEQRRESIVKAAVEVFAATGYRAGRVSDVAARVGVTEPVIFQNFGSKAALFAAVLERVAGDVRADLQTMVDHFGSASDLLAHVLNPSPAHAPGSHGTLFADAVTLAAEPELTEPARQALRTIADHLADLLRRGQADGDIRADLDPETAAWLLLSVLSARPARAAAMLDRDRLEDGVAALTLQALVPPTPVPPRDVERAGSLREGGNNSADQ
jgi:AcrR family transcriptional regulator